MAAQLDPEKEEAMRQRIVAHMNAEHQESLSRYLRHHHGLSARAAASAQLADITPSALTLTASPPRPGGSGGEEARTYGVPLDPPLLSLAGARERLVAMDAESLAALGLSSIPVTRYVPPPPRRPVHLFVFVSCVFMFATCWRRGNFERGSWVREYAVPGMFFDRKDWADWFARYAYKLQPWLFWPIFLLHFAEAVTMARTRMRKHQVPAGSVLWVKWVGSTFIEGVGCFIRFDEMIEKEKSGGKSKKDH